MFLASSHCAVSCGAADWMHVLDTGFLWHYMRWDDPIKLFLVSPIVSA